MKNELGIEVKCENCITDGTVGYKHCVKCKEQNFCNFDANFQAYEQRIIELQEQQFTKEEFQFIKNRLDECIEEWDVPDMVFMAHQILKKIEQTLKNLEGNSNKGLNYER